MWTCVQGICTWVPGTGVPDLSCADDVDDSPCGRMSRGGWALATAAAVFNGSFAAFVKARRVQAGRVPVHVFNAWACLGVVLCSLPLAWLVGFRCLGSATVLSGVLLVLAAVCTYAAVQLAGLSQAAGIWSGSAALTAYATGLLREGSSPHSALLVLAGTAAVALGALGTSAAAGLQAAGVERAGQRRAASSVGSSRWRHWGPREARAGAGDAIAEEPDLEGLSPSAVAAAAASASASAAAAAAAVAAAALGSGGGGEGAVLNAPLLGPAAGGGGGGAHGEAFRRRHGAAMAVMAGTLSGLGLVPLGFAPYECRGLPWVPGMAVGVAAAAPAVTLALHLFTTRKDSPRRPLRLAPAAAAAAGLASGALLAAGNVCCVLAVQYLGFGAAYPAMQAGLFVAGLLGITLFGELTLLLPQLLFWLSGAVLVAGAALLAVPAAGGV